MHIGDGLRSSFQAIFSHKLRSFLTLSGIVIGVMAVVTMFSSIYGLKMLIKKNMAGMGWDQSLIVVDSGNGFSMFSNESSQTPRKFIKTRQLVKSLDIEDYQTLKDNLDVKSIYGVIQTSQRYYQNQKEEIVEMKATNTEFFHNKTYPLRSGRYFLDFEEKGAAQVCILGHFFAKKHFPNTNPIGQTITLGNMRYRVIGVLAANPLGGGNLNFNNWERDQELKAVYIPLQTGAKYLRSQNRVDYIYVQARDDASYSSLKGRVRQTLLRSRNMYQNFSFQDIGAFLFKITKEINDAFKKWNITLFAIASVSLLVGGIGLFSTLLISINERMVEIGVRKSIGATESDIFFYFIMEAVTLAVLGAVFGILVAGLLLKVFSSLIHMSLPVPMQGVLIGLGFSILIGFLSGLYPALKAARINPIQAIYYYE